MCIHCLLLLLFERLGRRATCCRNELVAILHGMTSAFPQHEALRKLLVGRVQGHSN